MRECTNLPIRMLAVCETDGKLRPLRFRLEDEDHQLQTVSVRQIVSSQTVQALGIDAVVFLCKGELRDRERLFELRYAVQSHRWTLVRLIY